MTEAAEPSASDALTVAQQPDAVKTTNAWPVRVIAVLPVVDPLVGLVVGAPAGAPPTPSRAAAHHREPAADRGWPRRAVSVLRIGERCSTSWRGADTDQVECAPIRSQAWLDEHEGDLHGLGADDAVALIEGAGLHARVVLSAGGWITQEQRSDRLTLWLSDAGTVASVDAG